VPVEPTEPTVEAAEVPADLPAGDVHVEVPSDEPLENAGDDPDLDHVGRRLAAVEAALERLDAGTYWTDEITGEAIPDHVLQADPVARRVTT
jgi:RNA polymerase-binding transcription factor DksA